jgi:hypothetical protein
MVRSKQFPAVNMVHLHNVLIRLYIHNWTRGHFSLGGLDQLGDSHESVNAVSTLPMGYPSEDS